MTYVSCARSVLNPKPLQPQAMTGALETVGSRVMGIEGTSAVRH